MTEMDAPHLAGVIGHPIAHSKSPVLHGHWLRRYGIRGYYIPMPVAAEHLAQALQALPRLGFRGVNITIPHKEAALELANAVSDRAALIGAANTLIFRSDGTIQADNTDGYGFLANLKQSAPHWRADAGPAVVLGAGGAARAVVSALLGDGAPEIVLANRTRARSDMLREHFGARVRVVEWTQVGSHMEGAATLVNTTSLGMTGKPELNVKLDRLPQTALVTDIVYAPLRTALLERAADRGNPTVDGLGMLLHQAVPGFEAWFGVRPEVDDELRAAVLEG
ncbi:shikimate dehydrogenase [Maritimibacter sp. 55A14]|uniref:shikimate dehydrogenase n=1 Tax=Maritimibacter sp. 55A14 TaxID=2174844 RepID=UPI000D60B390|nr:shikimate dehydrogenase [Maritimibacter sp. 55A14]PWE33564.1 shikimate dehydrogenase [Maritimibacter sp. 55A14]